ncbi:MAG: YafY family protein [Candidatus Limiplasma sp.]|nr:YafY family protein [Candidatus Limiplasma sp.]
MKIDRLIGILSILLQQEKVTAPYLAEKFEVSRRTINRDIEQLCQAGIPLMTTQGQSGGVSIIDGYSIDRTLLSSADMQAILAGLRSLDSISGTNRYIQLMEKLSVGASNRFDQNSHMLIDLSSWYKSSLAPKIELILSCIEGSTVIDFTYFSPKGESKRTIEPYDLVFQWSSWYAWGWCLQRQEFRLFKLNRMTQIKSGARYEKRAVPIPDLSSEKVFPNKYQVKALISLEYEWRLVEEYGRDSFTKQPDGRLLFSFGFADHDNIISWILTFGNEAELLEPLEFRKELFEIGKRMQELYAHS